MVQLQTAVTAVLMRWSHCSLIETVSLEGTFCDNVQVPSGADDTQLI